MAIQHLQRIVITADALADIEADVGALAELVFGVDTATDDLVYSIDDGVTWVGVGGVATDEKAKVSANDTTAGYLNGKLVAGSGITLTENSDGGNETLTIAADYAAVISSTSTIPTGHNAYVIGPVSITGSLTINGSFTIL